MRNARWLTLFPGLLLLLTALSGCRESRTVEVLNIYQNGNCQQIINGVTPVSYQDIARMRGARLLSMSEPDSSISTSVKAQPQVAPEPLLLAISKGEQPTPGFALNLAGPGILKNRILEIPVFWQHPAAGSILAQMTSSPCLVVGVSKNGFDKVRIVDQDGTILATLDLARQSAS